MSEEKRKGRAYFILTEANGDIDCEWVLKLLENMQIKMIGRYSNQEYESQSSIEAFYINPNQTFKFVKLGGDANVDTIWS